MKRAYILPAAAVGFVLIIVGIRFGIPWLLEPSIPPLDESGGRALVKWEDLDLGVGAVAIVVDGNEVGVTEIKIWRDVATLKIPGSGIMDPTTLTLLRGRKEMIGVFANGGKVWYNPCQGKGGTEDGFGFSIRVYPNG